MSEETNIASLAEAFEDETASSMSDWPELKTKLKKLKKQELLELLEALAWRYKDVYRRYDRVSYLLDEVCDGHPMVMEMDCFREESDD